MKRIQVDDEEYELIQAHRRKKAHETRLSQIAEFRKACDHNYVFSFSTYKVDYYICDKCGQRTSKSYDSHARADVIDTGLD